MDEVSIRVETIEDGFGGHLILVDIGGHREALMADDAVTVGADLVEASRKVERAKSQGDKIFGAMRDGEEWELDEDGFGVRVIELPGKGYNVALHLRRMLISSASDTMEAVGKEIREQGQHLLDCRDTLRWLYELQKEYENKAEE